MSKLPELRQARADMLASAADLVAKMGLDETDDDTLANLEADYEGLTKRLDANKRSIERMESLDEETKAALKARPVAKIEPQAKKVPEAFANFGEQLQAVARAFQDGNLRAGMYDQRLGKMDINAAASGANEAVPSDGGFLVQQDFSLQLLNMMHEMGEVISRVRRVPISTNANSIKLPAVDETSRVDGSRWGGVRAYWANEADTVTASRPKFRTIDLTLEKLMAIGYATEELLQDASALESVMMQAFAEEMSFKAEDAIINGDGSGKPLGVLNSGAVVSVAAESGQAVSTVVTQNILNMWSRLPIRARRSAVWYINQDVEKQLYALTLGSGTAVVLLYTPPGVNGNNSPYGLLMGRPVIPVEYCATLGTAGDIILMDPQSYVMADKGGVAAAQSMHVRFLYDEMTFRFTYRLDGQPIWRTALTPFKGANTLSPYITLAARA